MALWEPFFNGNTELPKNRLIKETHKNPLKAKFALSRAKLFMKSLKKTSPKTRESLYSLLSVLIIVSFVTTPASAGIFSKINASTSLTDELSLYDRDDFSGVMDGLLVPVRALNPREAIGGSEITIYDDALSAISGPLGSSATGDFTRQNADQIYLYKVRNGDTLSSIAERFGVEPNTIRWANGISRSGVIQIDQVLTILPISGIQHKVVKGETLASIAKKYGADIQEVADFNIIDSDSSLTVGDTIIVPGGELTEVVVTKTKSAKFNTKAAGVGSIARSNSINYISPVSGCVLTQGIHSRNAVDLGCPKGTPIYAPADGTVLIAKKAGWNGGFGIYAVITFNDGTQGVFGHQSALAVGAGESVVQGQIIGYVGSTGHSTGYHLHFEHRGGARNYMAR